MFKALDEGGAAAPNGPGRGFGRGFGRAPAHGATRAGARLRLVAGKDAPASLAADPSGLPVLDAPLGKTAQGPMARRVAAFEAWWARLDLVHDLAEDIGSRRWYRGLVTLVALAAMALAFWPDFSALEAATPLDSDLQARAEMRGQLVAPLGLGSGTGRRMDVGARVRSIDGAPETPDQRLAAVLAQGDTLPAMLARVGVGAGDLDRTMALVASAVAPAKIADGTRFDVTLGARPAPGLPRALERIDFRAAFDLDLTVRRTADGALALDRHPVAIDSTPLRIRGAIGPGIYRTARAAGAPVAAIQAYLQAVDENLSIESDLLPTDQFDMILGYQRSADGERRLGNLLYAGVERDGKPRLQLLRWGNDGHMVAASNFTSGGSSGTFAGMPVAGHITSLYGMRRHPILGYTRMHAGVDFGAPYGSPIYAVADGVVTFAGRHGGHGNYVRLDHGGGLGTGYGHMSRIAVSPGTTVRAGQVIGYVGSTGLSTGPHLHFEAYRNGATVNPLGMTFVSAPRVDTGQLDVFKKRIAQLMAVPVGAALTGMAPAPATPTAGAREIDRLGRADPR